MEEQIIFFTSTDNSIDIVGAFVFGLAAFHSTRYFILNNLNKSGKIIYSFIIILSLLHIAQVVHQVIVGSGNSFTLRLWDIINYLTAFLFLIGAHKIYKTKDKK
jgi:hypothetical protein